MRSILLLVALLGSTWAQLSHDHVAFFPASNEFYNVSGKNISSLTEAMADAQQLAQRVSREQGIPSLAYGLLFAKKPWKMEDALGQIDLENQVPATLHSKYRLASISKTFVSALIGHLVDEGRLSYDTPINQILRPQDFPVKRWKSPGQKSDHPVNITVGQLLSHTAGLHYTDDSDFDNVTVTPNTTMMIHKFKDEPLLFEPGTRFSYSNYGYQVLGAIIESATKRTFVDAMRDFLHKHKFTETKIETADLITKNRAQFYRNAHLRTENLPTDVWDELFMIEGWWAAGGLMSTVPDLLRHGQMMIDAYKGRPNGEFGV